MRKKLFNLLIRRAKKLYKDSLRNYKERFYDLALVYLEQALRLFLKAILLKKFGDFPKTHKIRELLNLLGFELSEEDVLIVNLLEDVYIGGRYLEKEYSKEEYEIALKFVKKIFKKYGFRTSNL